MKVVFSDKYKIVKEKKFHAKESDILLILPLLIQILLSYLGNRFNSIFYFLEVIPILFLFYMLHRKIKRNTIDLLIIIYVVLLLALFAIDLITLNPN